VTWLYGPLEAGAGQSLQTPSASPTIRSRTSESKSLLNKRPILKKRSLSEITLQNSLSSSSLLKRAAAAVQALQSPELNRPSTGRPEIAPIAFAPRPLIGHHPSLRSSTSSTRSQSPGSERKHIQFNEQVKQCISLDIRGIDSCSHSDSKTITSLPSTPLKYRVDTPEPCETTMRYDNGFWTRSRSSPFSWQDILWKPSTRMLLEGDGEDMDWQPTSYLSSQDNNMIATLEHCENSNASSCHGELSGMGRTPSTLLRQYQEDEEAPESDGLFEEVADTVNAANDIAHIVWWRR
jgi:hypothetical protein